MGERPELPSRHGTLGLKDSFRFKSDPSFVLFNLGRTVVSLFSPYYFRNPVFLQKTVLMSGESFQFKVQRLSLLYKVSR